MLRVCLGMIYSPVTSYLCIYGHSKSYQCLLPIAIALETTRCTGEGKTINSPGFLDEAHICLLWHLPLPLLGCLLFWLLSLWLQADHRGYVYELFCSVMLSTTNVIATDKTTKGKKERWHERLRISKGPCEMTFTDSALKHSLSLESLNLA